ncbi:MAG: cell division protein FtsX [Alphaproteobacteria bacterium]
MTRAPRPNPPSSDTASPAAAPRAKSMAPPAEPAPAPRRGTTHPARRWLRQVTPAFRPGTGNDNGANAIIPPRTMARRALMALISIMSFLACLTAATVSVVHGKAESWQRQISDEVTIQIRPIDGGNIEDAVARAVDIALQIPGVRSAGALSSDESAALLEPWLGRDFDLEVLAVPRLVAVRVAPDADLASLARRLGEAVPGATVDDHGQWLSRLASAAGWVTWSGVAIVLLVLSATALSVVFATRGAMASNHDVIEVLHFIGAEDSYIATEFQRHFLALGLKGAAMGGGVAIGLFLIAGFVSGLGGERPENAAIRSLFGDIFVGPTGYAATVAIIILVAAAVAITARLTVQRTIGELG